MQQSPSLQVEETAGQRELDGAELRDREVVESCVRLCGQLWTCLGECRARDKGNECEMCWVDIKLRVE